jgi:hypothetical protein
MSYKTSLAVVTLNLLNVAGCASTQSDVSIRENIREITSPATARAFSPRLTAMRDGSVVLTWLEPEKLKYLHTL